MALHFTLTADDGSEMKVCIPKWVHYSDDITVGPTTNPSEFANYFDHYEEMAVWSNPFGIVKESSGIYSWNIAQAWNTCFGNIQYSNSTNSDFQIYGFEAVQNKTFTASNGKSVEFLPDTGHVKLYNADGSLYKQTSSDRSWFTTDGPAYILSYKDEDEFRDEGKVLVVSVEHPYYHAEQGVYMGSTYNIQFSEEAEDTGFALWWLLKDAKSDDDVDTDPYSNNSTSTSGGGGHIDTTASNDSTPLPSLPDIDETAIGNLYELTKSQLRKMMSTFWTSEFLDDLLDAASNKFDNLVSLTVTPFDIEGGTNTRHITVGNRNIDLGEYVGMAKEHLTAYCIKNCGTITINPHFSNYLDFAPYTSYELYLPYVGCITLDTDLLMTPNDHKITLGVEYHVDVVTGASMCYVYRVFSGTYGESGEKIQIIGQYSCNTSMSLPLTGQSYRERATALLSLGASIVGTAVSGNPIGLGDVASNAVNVMSSKPQTLKAGNLSSNNGILGYLRPYLLIKYPTDCSPENQIKFTGYPSFVTYKLGSLSGYHEIAEIKLDGIPCTEDEKIEIDRLLKGGVYL